MDFVIATTRRPPNHNRADCLACSIRAVLSVGTFKQFANDLPTPDGRQARVGSVSGSDFRRQSRRSATIGFTRAAPLAGK